MTSPTAQDAGCSAIPRSRWWKFKYRLGDKLWWIWLPICSRVYAFATKRTGMGVTFSSFWYGISEGAWTVVCGHSLTAGLRYMVWIWRGCPHPFPSERRP